MAKRVSDSTNNVIEIGDTVRFRGREYEIDHFVLTQGLHGVAEIYFTTPQHTDEIATEISVDLVI